MASFLSSIASWPSKGAKQRYAPDLDGTITLHHHSAALCTINVVTTTVSMTRDGRLFALLDGVVSGFRRQRVRDPDECIGWAVGDDRALLRVNSPAQER